MKPILLLSLLCLPLFGADVTPKHHYHLGYKHDTPGKIDPNWKGHLDAMKRESDLIVINQELDGDWSKSRNPESSKVEPTADGLKL